MRWLLAAALAVMFAIVLGVAWVAGTEAGARWLAASAQTATGGKLRIDGLEGTLADRMRIRRLSYEDEALRLEASELVLRVELLSLIRGQVHIRSVHADALEADVLRADKGTRDSASLPFGIRIDEAGIDALRWEEYEIEELEVRGAGVSRRGAVSASVHLLLPDPVYPALLNLEVHGTLQRLDALLSGTVARVAVSAKATLARSGEWRIESLDATAGPVDLSALDSSWPRTRITAQVSGAAGTAALAGKLALRNALPGPMNAQRLPLATLDARFATDFESFRLHDLEASLSPGGMLAGNAQLHAGNVSFVGRASGIDLRSFHSELRATRLQGPVRFSADAQKQSLTGTLTQDDMSVTADAVRENDVIDIRSLRASAAGGEASGKGRILLGEPLRIAATSLKLSGFNPARFGDYPEGSVSGELEASGSLADKQGIEVRWSIGESVLRGATLASRGSARVFRERITRVKASATLGSAKLDVQGAFGRAGDKLQLELQVKELKEFALTVSGRGSGQATLLGTWGEPRARVELRASQLQLPNDIALRSLHAKGDGTLKRHEIEIALQAQGIDLTALLRGGWDSQQGWVGTLQELRNPAPYPLALSAPAPLALAPDRVQLRELNARVGEGSLRVDELSWSPSKLASRGEASALPAHWLLLAFGLEDELQGNLLLNGAWNLTASPRLDGRLTLSRTGGDLAVREGGPIELGLEKVALELAFTDGRVQASGDVASRFGTAEVRGMLAPDADAPGLGITQRSAIALRTQVNFVDIGVLAAPALSDMRVEGRLRATVEIAGTLGEPALAGGLSGEGLALQIPPYGVYLSNGKLQARLEQEGIRVTSFSIDGGKGTLSASGLLPLRAQTEARVEWQAENLSLLQRPDLQLVVSGSGTAELADKRIALTGKLRAEHGQLELAQERLPQLGDDVVIAGETRALARERTRVPLALDVQLDLGDALHVRGYGLDGRLAGALRVQTTKDGELRAYGRIHTVRATFFAYGQTLEVDPGIAIFDGPIDNPTLQLTAWRRKQQVEVGVQISGTARAPQVQLVSQPPVPEGERISWLVLGRPPSDATKADLGLLQVAAGALLASGEDAPLDRRIARAFGVDEISLRGSGGAAEKVVAVRKRLSDRLYVSYEQGIGAAVSALVKLDFTVTQRISVRAQTGTASAIGLFYRFSWD